jgi:transcriptional regulator with XRE-family HTH domain
MEARRILGRNVQRLRKSAGITQEKLTFATGLHPTYISGIERGHRNPSVDVLEKLAKALNVPIGSLFDH